MKIPFSSGSKILTKETLLYILAFFGLRLISLLLVDHHIVQGIIVFVFLFAFAGIYFKNQLLAWNILIAELLLGGSGLYLEIGGISLRTALLGTFIFIWLMHLLYDGRAAKKHVLLPHPILFAFMFLAVVIVLSTFNGLMHNEPLYVIQDAIPYLYFFLLIPAFHVYQRPEMQASLIRMITAMAISSALYSLTLFLLFSGGVLQIHDPVYKWIRDIGAGKITDLGGFFRVVFPMHLLLVPVTLVSASILLSKVKKIHSSVWLVIASSLVVFALNLSRAYILALIVGYIVLIYRHNFAKWFRVSLTMMILFCAIFFGTALIGSGGKSLGLNHLGLRAASLIDPSVETSTHTRMALLAPIADKISEHPITGNGLGTALTFYPPFSSSKITTREYDWGVLEIWSELGIFGFIMFTVVFVMTMYYLIDHIRHRYHEDEVDVGLLASLFAMLILGIFGPVLSHVFGVLMFSGIMAVTIQPHSMREEAFSALHRWFHA